MKGKMIKLAILGAILFGSCLGILGTFLKSIILVNEDTDDFNKPNLKSTGSWDLTGSPILIDDSDPAKNWAFTALNYAWCSGSGSWSDPYLIENVTINGLGFSNCIEIRNSNAYFIIRNSTLYNPFSNDYGIYLLNTNNSRLIDNNFSEIDEAGIHLENSYNNTLSGNIIIDYQITNGNGIDIVNSDNNTLLGNVASNRWYGINLDNSDNNTLSGNSASINNFVGIRLDYSNYNTLSGNTANDNKNGIGGFYSDDNTVSGNTVSNNDFVGIHLGYMYYNTLSGNIANNNRDGFYLEYSDNNTLSGNTVSNNDANGIELWFSHNNTFSGNTVSNNTDGIYLMISDNSTLTGNIINNNEKGINLLGSISTTLSGNLMDFCGIYLYGSLVAMASHSIDTTNLVNSKPVYYYVNEIGLGMSNFSNAGQIILVNCNESTISGFDLSDSTVGILLGYSNNNSLSGNTVNNNEEGIYLGFSHNNTLSANTANNNQEGIKLGFSHNNMFYENSIQNNEEYGIYIYNGTQNLFFQNYFINNTIHAYDDGINNYWNNSVIGNYWDNYTGVDADNDGIGDTPYSFHGGTDYLPMIEIPQPTPSQNIPGYNILIILGLTFVMAGIITRKKLNH